MLKKWLKDNSAEEKAVIIYSIYQPVAKSVISLCKKNGIPCFAIVPDLPRDMFANEKISCIRTFEISADPTTEITSLNPDCFSVESKKVYGDTIILPAAGVMAVEISL